MILNLQYAHPDLEVNRCSKEKNNENSRIQYREKEKKTSENIATAATGKITMSGSEPVKVSSSNRTSDAHRLVKRHNIINKLETAMKQEPPEDEEEDCYLEDRPPRTHASSISGTHTGRVRSHARSLRAMANPSAVWAHFDLCANDALRAQCRICGSVVVRGGANPRQCGTTNLHRHLRVHHGGRLIGRRYHVMQPGSQSNSNGRTIRIATQSLVRQPLRNIAPAPSGQHRQQQPKTLVLKTLPLKVKQVAPTTIKMAPRQQNVTMPQNILPQQSTEVCLRWNSYHSNMQNSFPSLLDTEQFVDVTLACEGRSLKCHKMILSSCSDYLAALLRENPCQHPIILMKDLKFWEVEALVKFMYRGEVNVAHEKLPQLLNAAEALQIKGLAGPSPSLQNPKPPKLIPQSKPLNPSAAAPSSRIVTETKEARKSTSSSTAANSSAIPKRVQKRQASEPPQPRIFTKIRLQRPVTPISPNPTVKLEPLDIPLSPTEIFSEHHRQDEDISSTASNFDNLVMALHEDEDPGGDDDHCSTDGDMNFSDIPGRSDDPNENEEQMEFVPTDFLEQEQDIMEEADGEFSKSSNDDTDVEEEEDLLEETIERLNDNRKKIDDRGNDKTTEKCTNLVKTL